MSKKYARSERGVAMMLELVLVAAVLAVVGLAVYGANNRSKMADAPAKPTVESVSKETARAAAVSSAREAALSAATAEATADEFTSAEADLDALGGADAQF